MCKTILAIIGHLFLNLQCIVAMLMVIPADIGSLIDFFSFAAWLFYGMAVFCVILLRFTRKNADRKIKVTQGLTMV